MIENSMVINAQHHYEALYRESTELEDKTRLQEIEAVQARLLNDEPQLYGGKIYRFDNVVDFVIDHKAFADALEEIVTSYPDSTMARIIRESANQCAIDIVEG